MRHHQRSSHHQGVADDIHAFLHQVPCVPPPVVNDFLRKDNDFLAVVVDCVSVHKEGVCLQQTPVLCALRCRVGDAWFNYSCDHGARFADGSLSAPRKVSKCTFKWESFIATAIHIQRLHGIHLLKSRCYNDTHLFTVPRFRTTFWKSTDSRAL